MATGNGGKFPPGFVFGVATSAYQVEGHIENDWAEWERAGRLKEPGARCGRAVEHWGRFAEDLGLAQRLGARAFRISLEWARIEPKRGEFDQAVLASYRERLVAMRKAGFRPVVTLHHFTHPAWFHRETPWFESASVEVFRRYVRAAAEVLRGQDALVITFNEPTVLVLGGFMQGLIPPGLRDRKRSVQALLNMLRSHVAAREELLNALGRVELGISQNVLAFSPDRPWHPVDRALCRLASWNYNHALIDALCTGTLRLDMPGLARLRERVTGAKESIDFVGINYYTRAHLHFLLRPPFVEYRYRDEAKRKLTDIGWEDYPEGFTTLLVEMSQYGLPVWVTENGIDDREGTRRPGYLYRHWHALLDAASRGVDVRGYLHWSLLDNFEWLEGWGPRFGLYRVDFNSLERTPTPACAYFRQVAESGVLTAPG